VPLCQADIVLPPRPRFGRSTGGGERGGGTVRYDTVLVSRAVRVIPSTCTCLLTANESRLRQVKSSRNAPERQNGKSQICLKKLELSKKGFVGQALEMPEAGAQSWGEIR